MFASSLALRLKIENDGTEAERRLSTMLFDEDMHALSTFEMNRIASLSYENETCEQLFDLIIEVVSQPEEHPLLAIQKTLAVTKHLLIYGSEKCVNSCWGITDYVLKLSSFNTVLASQRKGGIGNWWHSVKGGSVDRGFTVRETATALHKLLGDAVEIRRMRQDQSDPNSLVPVGEKNKAGFVSDELRHYMLKRRMEEQNLMRTKSNLAKAHGGYGSGFNAKNGQTVVGAAHGLEEMLARAAKEEKKFTEKGPTKQQQNLNFSDYQPPNNENNNKKTTTTTKTSELTDLLGFEPATAPSPQMDL